MDIKCPNCEAEYEIDESIYGRFVRCEVCGKGFVAGTSAAKKLGEAAKAAKDAMKIAANTAYERTKNIDWKAQQEKAKIIADSAYRKGKWFWRSLRDSYEEWDFARKLSRLWYAFSVALKAFVDGRRTREEQRWADNFINKPAISKLLASAPWTLQFATVYLIIFGLAFVVCNLLTSKFPASIISSLIILAIVTVVEYFLVRVRVVSWLLFAWGVFNCILLLFGARAFACFWTFHISFVAIAILLVLPITQKWYRDGPRVNPVANLMSFKKVSVLAALFGIIAGIVLYCNFSAEQQRIRSLRGLITRDDDNNGTITIEGIVVKRPPGGGFERLFGDDKNVSYCAEFPCNCDDEWDCNPKSGPVISIDIIKWNPKQSMEDFVLGFCAAAEGRGLKPGIIDHDDTTAQLTVIGKILGNEVFEFIKVIHDVKNGRCISITGRQSSAMFTAWAKNKNPRAAEIIDLIVECVSSAYLLE